MTIIILDQVSVSRFCLTDQVAAMWVKLSHTLSLPPSLCSSLSVFISLVLTPAKASLTLNANRISCKSCMSGLNFFFFFRCSHSHPPSHSHGFFSSNHPCPPSSSRTNRELVGTPPRWSGACASWRRGMLRPTLSSTCTPLCCLNCRCSSATCRPPFSSSRNGRSSVPAVVAS